MPYCHVQEYERNSKRSHGSHVARSKNPEDLKLFYQLYGHGSTKVLLIIGLAATHDAWGPQLIGLCGTDVPNEAEIGESEDGEQEEEEGAGSDRHGSGGDVVLESHGATVEDCLSTYSEGDRKSNYDIKEQTGNGVQVCTFDNRGVGKSSIPQHRSLYSTKTMAKDALALLDHLGWSKAHICGHSMGGMIACKLAAMAPHRVSSLTLIGVTGGGYQCLPKLNRTTLSIAYRILRAKTPEARAEVDLDTHFTYDYLESVVGEEKRRNLLFKEYVRNLSNAGMQPKHGLEGQAYACWKHGLASEELHTIRSAGVIVTVIHGREDVIAQVEHARKLARKLHPVCRMVELPGGHLVTHQNTDEVNEVLLDMVRAVNMNVQCYEWEKIDANSYGEVSKIPQDEGQGETNQQVQVSSPPLQGRLKTSGSAVSVYAIYSMIMPEWVDILYVFPFLHWTAKVIQNSL
ncbi:hypothetical protein MPTK1_8g08160 [Marchantia polymorpha subsp. ruderalis]|uniref:AB hydrolase-1 domain-containing protein n=1 Tax=Marchantia polymorpha TaxID=3197 RepID=A0A2R6W4F3_MARPO|nr:hypothetical protein MARPO_0155s0003 [Marchantia polymorpha]BBN19136.1 hypothetical protein Mp_8g08160 [Marchantia polymorpha subsp. ruderalis]|eukprot:PTQ28736.1 hypothetical protein MARPO_0155s0003 [Marchantia polymorpha]